MSLERPWTLISIWIAVTPTSVPVTLKSMSPRKSSIPWISERIANSDEPSSFTLSISPIAIPATGLLSGTPASISARQEPHVEPMEVEPLDDSTSDTTLMA